MSLLDEVLARKQTALATATEPGTVPAHGTTAGTTLVFDGSDMVWGAGAVPAPVLPADGDFPYYDEQWDGIVWGRPERISILGARAPHMTGWQLDEADGCYVQSSAGVAGELILPLGFVTPAQLFELNVMVYRTTGTGAAPGTLPTATVERQLQSVGDGTPGAWVAAGFTWSLVGTAANRLHALRGTYGGYSPVAGAAYRLRITGEAGTNAQPLKLLEVTARAR